MKNFLPLLIIIALIVSASDCTYANQPASQQRRGVPDSLKNRTEAFVPGVSGVSVLNNGSVAGTSTYDPNEDVSLIVQFKSPLPAGRWAKSQHDAPDALSRSAILSEHNEFHNDIERIESQGRKGHSILKNDARTQIRFEFSEVLNGAAITTKRWMVQSLSLLPYVKSIANDEDVHAVDDNSNAEIGVDSCWALENVKGDSVVIGILDTGIDYLHESLGGAKFPNAKVIGGYDFVNGDADPMDDNGHGTHVAAIVAGDGPLPLHLQGVAPHAALMAFKVLDNNGQGKTSQVIAGIEKAVDPDGNPETHDGVDIISMSLGGPGDPDSPLAQAVNNAVSAGVLCVVAAGNSGPTNMTIACPGNAGLALTVGAIDNSYQIPAFSSCGPSASSFDCKPEVIAPGVGINSAKRGGGYIRMSGTSMATPHAAGVAALLVQLHRSWAPSRIKAAIIESSTDEGFSVWSEGAGCINALKASKLLSTVSPATVNFGFDDLGKSAWAQAETLTVYNDSPVSKTYFFSANSGQSGVSISFSAGTVTVPGNGSALCIATLSIDNALVPFPHLPPCFNGKILVRMDVPAESLTVLWNFTKAPLLDLTFDTAPWFVMIHNNADLSLFYPYPGSHLSMVLPQGTYDILVRYAGAARIVLRENIVLSKNVSLAISPAEATHQVFISTVDANSAPMPFDNAGLVMLTNKVSGFGISIAGSISDSADWSKLYFSNVSSNYRFDLKTSAFSDASHGDYYEFPFRIDGGINASMTLSNDPAAFKSIQYTYAHPATSQELCFVPYFFRPVSSDKSGYRFSLNYPFSQSPYRIQAPFTLHAYYLPNPASDFPVPSSYQDVYDISTGNAEQLYSSVHVLPILPDTLILGPYKAPVLVTTAKVTGITLGDAPPQWNGMLQCNGTDITLSAKAEFAAGLFLGPDGDFSPSNMSYEIVSNGVRSASGIIPNTFAENAVQHLSLESGENDVIFRDTAYAIAGRQGIATIRHHIDTRSSVSDPLSVNILRLESFGSTVHTFVGGRFNELHAQIANGESVQSVQLYYKDIADSVWLSLQSTGSSGSFFAPLPQNLEPGMYSIRVNASGTGNNSVEYSLEPAFTVRGVTFTPQSLFYADADTTESITDSTMVILSGVAGGTVSVATDAQEFSVAPKSFTPSGIDSQKIYVTFSPSSSGRKTGHILFTFAGSGIADTLNVSGRGVGLNQPVLIGTMPDTTGFRFSWRSISRAASYDLQISADSDFAISVQEFSSIPDTGFSTAVSGSGSLYFWRVRARNPLTGSDWSSGKLFSAVRSMYSLSVAAGWNLVSVPMNADPYGNDSLTAGASSQIFTYEGKYNSTAAVTDGKGYWIKYDGARRRTVSGAVPVSSGIEIRAGWNLIGCPDTTAVAVSSLVPAGTTILSQFYGYTGGYHSADSLYPGKGYWVKAGKAGMLNVVSPHLAPKTVATRSTEPELNRLVIRDAKGNQTFLYVTTGASSSIDFSSYDLPPVPPTGALDARFTDGRNIVVMDTAGAGNYPVQFSGAMPVTVQWDIRFPMKEDIQLFIDNRPVTISGTGSAVITDAGSKVSLIVAPAGGTAKPKAFSLAQNYPNPFNPSTTIEYYLPISARVTLKVFNMLGQEMATVVDGNREAGRQVVQLDCSNFPSGAYLYRISAHPTDGGSSTGSFTEVKRMMLVK